MKSLVLSSGGVDSTTCVSMAIKKFGKENVSTVSFYYGQTLSKELECARKIAEYYDLPHYEFDLSEMFKYSNCTLLKRSTEDIRHESYEEQVTGGKRITSYVPFRNGLMLSAVATLAQSLYPEDECTIVLGNHASDFAYADCSLDFTTKMNDAIKEGTYGLVEFWSPLVAMSKTDVVATGLKLGTPYELTWSCYEGKDRPCGVCGSCISREKAFMDNGVEDPALK